MQDPDVKQFRLSESILLLHAEKYDGKRCLFLVSAEFERES